MSWINYTTFTLPCRTIPRRKDTMKHYTIRCPYCGATHNTPTILLKLRLLFKDKIYHNCTVCHHKSAWINIFHLRHESMDQEEKSFNRRPLFDGRL